MKNKYGKISGGEIFDVLDKRAHLIAIDEIGECVTASAEIKYFKETDIIPYENSYIILHKTNNYVIIKITFEGIAFAIFTFIKRK